jgi:tRNA threonylcarbamoyladenosine biosynthesis protein TsaE
MADPEELEFLGLRELADGRHWLLIEWPEKGEGHLPSADLHIDIRMVGEGRLLHLSAGNTAATVWLASALSKDTPAE